MIQSTEQFHRPTWCEIDLSAIDRNIRLTREIVGPSVKLFVCLKGNASGCGAIEVGFAAQRAGADGLAFGNIDFALESRRAGIDLPILLYHSCLPASAHVLEANGMIATLSTREDIVAWSAQTRSRLEVFLKVDCGGLRAGALPRDAVALATAIAADPKLSLAGVYGHTLATYGKHVPGAVEGQIGIFRNVIAQIEQAGIRVPLKMFSSSELIPKHPAADFNAIDPGRLIVGIGFPAVPERQRQWSPALVGLKSRLVMKKALGPTPELESPPPFDVRANMVIGLIPFGWSYGYPRQMPPSATALVKGRRVRILGPTHSELMRIDLTDVPGAEVGDEVVLFGKSEGEEITMEELAQQWGVGTFDIYNRIGKSVARRYV